MSNWIISSDSTEPKLFICITLDHWDQHEAAIRAWCRNEGKGESALYSEGAVYVDSDLQAMFLLRFGP